eukprot:12153174-Alexandrium_andersonii.AAC.1
MLLKCLRTYAPQLHVGLSGERGHTKYTYVCVRTWSLGAFGPCVQAGAIGARPQRSRATVSPPARWRRQRRRTSRRLFGGDQGLCLLAVL